MRCSCSSRRFTQAEPYVREALAIRERDVGDLRKDVNALGGAFEELAGRLRGLPDRDVRAIAALLPPDGAAVQLRTHAALRADPKRSTLDAFAAALETTWESGWRDQVASRLRDASDPRSR